MDGADTMNDLGTLLLVVLVVMAISAVGAAITYSCIHGQETEK